MVVHQLNYKAIAEQEHNFAFASDNMAGIHPEILDEIKESNQGFAAAYHNDSISASTFEMLLDDLGFDKSKAAIAWAPTGTAANVLALAHLARAGAAVVCTNWAHITTDEAGSPEVIAGLKIREVNSTDGKLDPTREDQRERFQSIEADVGVERRAQPEILSISQSTEMGTVYSLNELRKLKNYCRYGIVEPTKDTPERARPWTFHLDGARIANAAVKLNCSLQQLVEHVDVLSFGFSKNGAMDCEAMIFRNGNNVDFKALVKSHMCIVAKSRFIASQAIAMLREPKIPEQRPLWHRTASTANNMASLLHTRLEGIGFFNEERYLVVPVDANAIIVNIPNELAARLRERFEFYNWRAGSPASDVRFMTSWQTTEPDVEAFVDWARECIEAQKQGVPLKHSHRRYALI
jgi:threonine aldolase